MKPSEERQRKAADTLEKIARVPTLQGGAVRFNADLSGGEWYPDAADAVDRTSWPCIVVPVPEHSDSYDQPGADRDVFRDRLMLAIRHGVERLELEQEHQSRATRRRSQRRRETGGH